jgi:hypothetical protein
VKRLIPIAAVALALAGCSFLQKVETAVTKPFNTTDPQKAVLALQQAHQVELVLFVAYLKQPPCGTAEAPPAPLCASYAVGVQWKKAEDAFDTAVSAAENAVKTMGDQTTIVNAAIATATNAYDALSKISDQYKGGSK